jgi:DNA modification methylase
VSEWHDDFVTIHHGDAWELAPTLAPQSIHTIVTSPPYWGLRDYGEPGQFGLEPTPDEYVAKLVRLFALLRPALRDDGTAWLNLGDSYASSTSNNGSYSEKSTLAGFTSPDTKGRQANDAGEKRHLNHGLKPKDLVGIPWRVAFALQADGWYLRSDIIWHKPNPMPESVTDRPTKAHEYLFLLSKQARYYYDHEAIKEPSVFPVGSREDVERGGFDGKWDEPGKEAFRSIADTRNKRSVWTIPTRPFSQAHFAVFPPDLIKPCILAGAPEKCCPECGAPWERVVERTCDYDGSKYGKRAVDATGGAISGGTDRSTLGSSNGKQTGKTSTVGFAPTCDHGHEPIGGTVLDPFMGSGTTAQVARSLGRKAVGSELNAEYIEMAAKHRLAQGVLL